MNIVNLLVLLIVATVEGLTPLTAWPYDANFTKGPIPFDPWIPDPSMFDGVINIGAFEVYGQTYVDGQNVNPYRDPSWESILGLKLWEYEVNTRDPPGLKVGNKTMAVNITIINTSNNDTLHGIITQNAVDGMYGHFDLYFGAWTTLKTLDSCLITEKAKIPMIAPWPSVTYAFECGDETEYMSRPPCTQPGLRRFQYMWGLIPTNDLYYDPALSILKLKGAKTFGGWTLYDTFALALVGGAETSALNQGMEVLTPLVAKLDWNILTVSNLDPSKDQVLSILTRMKNELDPDFLLNGNRLLSTCAYIIESMEELDYAPRAAAFSQCDLTQSNVDLLGDKLRYFLDYNSWDPTAYGNQFDDKRDFVKNSTMTSSERFSSRLYSLAGIYGTSYSATTYTCGYTLEIILEKCQTLDPEKMNAAFPLVLETTFRGPIGFNGYGFNDKQTMCIVQRDQNNDLKTVYPSGTATNDIIYPFVAWSARVFKSEYLGESSEVAMFVIFCFCMAFTLVCLMVLSIPKYWNGRAIKASSPVFMAIMLIGSAFIYSTVITWMIYTDVASCHLRIWLLNIGFTLLFGTLAAKTHRIKELFLLKKMRPKKFSDKKLLLIVAGLISVDILLCILWSAITQPTIEKMVVQGTGVEDGRLWENLNFNECNYGDDRTAMNVFFGLEGAYKALMVFYGLFLSLSLWRYGSSMWVESKQIIFSMYNLIIFALIGLALQLSLSGNTDHTTRTVLFITRSMCMFLSGFITIVVMILPRLFDPDGKEHEGKDTTGTKRTIDTAAVQLSDLEWKYEVLEKKYNELKKKYKDKNPDDSISNDNSKNDSESDSKTSDGSTELEKN